MNSHNPGPRRVCCYAAGGVVSVAPSAMPAMPGVFHFAHFRCKKGVEIIFDLSNMSKASVRLSIASGCVSESLLEL